MTDIPGLNYNIRQSSDRLKMQADVYNEEFVERLLLVMGHPDAGFSTEYGVVSPNDPAATTSGDGTPFSVAANASDPETIDVNAGIAVTKSSMWVKLADTARALQLADPSIGVTNVVYLRYLVEPADDEVNDFNQPVSPYTMRIGSEHSATPEDAQIDVDTLDVYVNYDDSVKDNYVPICLVTNQSVQDPLTGVTSNQLSFDFTRDAYTWNRPWFSAVDIVHRSMVGTGVQSITNPHATSQNDLTVGDFSPFQLQLDHGVVVADDQSVAKIPGVRCQVSIPYDTLLTDDSSGTYTTYPNAKYVQLTNYPIRLGKVWIESTGEDWGARIVAETNRVVFPYDPPVDESIGMYYTKVTACEPPVGTNEIMFSTNNPISGELIVAGGLGFTQLSNTQEPFSDAQKIPMIYELLVDGEGSLIKTPRVIYCYKRLEDIGTSDTFDIDIYGPGKIMMALADASGSPTMSIKIRMYGKDASGNTQDFLFDFTTGWNDPGPIPRTDIEVKAYRVSDTVFSAVDQIVIEEMTDYGVNAAIMMWVALNPYDTYDKLKDACHISEVIWDGLRLAEIRDKRIVNTTTRDFLDRQLGHSALPYMTNVLAGGNETVYAESFLQPRYHDQIPNAARSSTLANVLPVNNMSKLRVGAYGYYTTRALPVGANPGTEWRIVLLPLDQRRTNIIYPYLDPPVFYGYGSVSNTWASSVMTAVPGVFNTFQVTLSEVPEMIKVRLATTEYEGMVIFG